MFVIPPLGLCFSVRKRDQAHAWDPEPETWARNLRFEDHLDQVLPGEQDMEPPRRRKSDDDMNPWLKLGLQYGLGAVLALYLVQQMTGDFKTMQVATAAKLDANTELMKTHIGAQSSVLERLDRADRTQGVVIDLLRAGCVNQAKSFEERNRCLVAGASR